MQAARSKARRSPAGPGRSKVLRCGLRRRGRRLCSRPRKRTALDNLLADWEKRNKEIHVLESKFYRWKYDAVFGNGQSAARPTRAA